MVTKSAKNETCVVCFLAQPSSDKVCWLVALRPSNMLVYLRDGSDKDEIDKLKQFCLKIQIPL